MTQGGLTHKVVVVFEKPAFDNMVFYFPGKGQLVLEARTARIIVDEDDIQMLGNKINQKRRFSFRFPTILKK